MSGANKIKFLFHHESFECKGGLNEGVFNSKQEWNHDQCRCECKEFDDWNFCRGDYMRNPRTSNCKYKKACECKIGEYLDAKNCSCKNCLFGKLVFKKCKYAKIKKVNMQKEKKKKKKNICHTSSISLVIIIINMLYTISCYFC